MSQPTFEESAGVGEAEQTESSVTMQVGIGGGLVQPFVTGVKDIVSVVAELFHPPGPKVANS